MDWVGIVIFILIMVFRALGESEKQRKQREERQKGHPPVARPERPQPMFPPEAIPPVIKPDWELPPIFSFPLFEEVKEPEIKEERLGEGKEPAFVLEDKTKGTPMIVPPSRKKPKEVAFEAHQKVREEQPKGQLAGLRLEQAVQGIIWSEVLQPPRALRPHGSRGTRGRY